MLGQIASQVEHGIGEQAFRRDLLGQQAIEGPAHLEGEAQQGAPPRRILAHFFPDQLGEPEPAPRRRGGGRDRLSRAQTVEQRAEPFVEIEIADHDHAREQQATCTRLPRMTDKGLGHRARGARTGQQQGQAGKAETVFGVARDQPRDQRIGKAAMRGDRIDLRVT